MSCLPLKADIGTVTVLAVILLLVLIAFNVGFADRLQRVSLMPHHAFSASVNALAHPFWSARSLGSNH